METLNAIFKRRSIRKYKECEVAQESIDTILKAGMQAPTARNLQPWHFIVINKKEILHELSIIHPHGKMLKEAAFAILVCGDKSIDETESYLIQDCSAATQNMLLVAYDIGIASVWLGVHPRKDRLNGIIDYFKLPYNIIPISLISFGISNEQKAGENRYNPERIKYNKW
ncbi:MAG: NADH dehydrogenase [Bacteroidetes bacterium GWE2_29_8]|nr:MAG: NADH dehydrogenase [Bacteroidetes bacterium GWE2_29_8]OFY18272.1 MAG: NADH dehydrogenase [Bacteroidetes bacterium GWF2_29_10]